MQDFLDATLLSRIQFAFTVSFHIIFPSFTIGLASFLAVIEGIWLKTGHPIYKELYGFWVKIFAVTFGMGVVSGVVMSYQFGTNWAVFADKIGSVLGPVISFEVLTAFFLEASFLGIMLFGWGRVSKKMHFISTVIVALGTLLSAFWILSANSWMHTPQGYELLENGVFGPKNWLEIIFNPSFPYRLVHMVIAAYLTTAFAIGGVSAWHLLKKKYVNHARITFAMAMLMAVFVTPIQMIAGDMHGLNTREYQPEKVAAMEGLWDTEKNVALKLFGIPDMKAEETKYAVEIPHLGSLILTHSWDGEVRGLKDWPPEDRPYAPLIFFAFRIMVGMGLLMLLTGVIAAILWIKGRIFQTSWFHRWCIGMMPAGFIAILSGWIVTEVGRQPYVVYGLLRTADAVSPVSAPHVAASLLVFFISYMFIFGAGIFYIAKLIQKGPQVGEWHETFGDHGVEHPVNIADIFPKQLKGER